MVNVTQTESGLFGDTNNGKETLRVSVDIL